MGTYYGYWLRAFWWEWQTLPSCKTLHQQSMDFVLECWWDICEE